MNFQILPNWFKKIALVAFLISSIIIGADDFIDGWNSASVGHYDYDNRSDFIETSNLFINFTKQEIVRYWFGIISIFSMLAYMLSKEKIEDDYIKLLRLESFQLSFIIILIISLLLFIFKKEFVYGVEYFTSSYLLLYLIIFFFKKIQL